MAKTTLIPELRFPEFKGNWTLKKLDDITSKIGSGKTPKGGEAVYQKEGIPFIRSQNVIEGNLILDDTFIPVKVHNEMSGSKVIPSDILLNITGGSIGRSCVVPNSFEEGNVNQHVSIIRLKKESPKFLQSILSSWRGQKLIYEGQTGSGREGLNFQSIRKFKVAFPSIPEQQKIASFLSAVDQRLQLLQNKKEKLEDYKKGVMQQIFSQEIRFKIEDKNGKLVKAPDWKEKKIKDLFNGLKGKGLSKDKLDENGQYKCILYGELYTTYKEVISKINSYTNTKDGVLSRAGDLLVPCSTTTSGIDLANVTALNEGNVLLGGDMTIMRAKQAIDNVYFAYYLSNFKKNDLAKFGQGITIVHLYFSHFKELTIHVPSIKEQQKIAAFLSTLDRQIAVVEKQLNQSKQFKQGLLQKMFV